MKKKISLKHIADKVGVSPSLVSYVLNGKRTDRINEDTAAKIKKAAAALRYRPNQIAKSLKTNQTLTIGLIVTDISNSFFSQLARIIENAAEQSGYTVLFSSSDDNLQRSGKLIDIFIDRQVDGLILAPVAGAETQVKTLLKSGLPFVLVDRYFPEIKTSYVALDNFQAAHDAVAHLAKNGSRRIGMIGYDTPLYHLQERARGYLAVLSEQNMPLHPADLKRIPRDHGQALVEKAIDALIDRPDPVDGLFFASNFIGAVAIKYLNKHRVKVPGDLAIVSIDETDGGDLFYAPLSYVKQPLVEMGEAAVRMLLEEIAQPKKRGQLICRGELVMQESSVKPGKKPSVRR